MTGIEAITAHNGWAISVVGVTIVFTGLTTLALIIAQLHKVLDLWDQRSQLWQNFKNRTATQTAPTYEINLNQDINEAARQFKMVVDRLGQPFALPKLLEFAENCGLYRPCSTLNILLQEKMITPDGKGYYLWTTDKESEA